MHLGGNHQFSTFRLSIGSILAAAYGDDQIHEDELTAWMHGHLRVITILVEEADTLDALETSVLAVLDPPLNLAKMARTDTRRQLSALRRQFGRKRRGEDQRRQSVGASPRHIDG